MTIFEFILLITVIFVLLKVYNKIDWKWIWVFSPILLYFLLSITWIGLFLIIGILIMVALVI